VLPIAVRFLSDLMQTKYKKPGTLSFERSADWSDLPSNGHGKGSHKFYRRFTTRLEGILGGENALKEKKAENNL
jgi:hypothetical protein